MPGRSNSSYGLICEQFVCNLCAFSSLHRIWFAASLPSVPLPAWHYQGPHMVQIKGQRGFPKCGRSQTTPFCWKSLGGSVCAALHGVKGGDYFWVVMGTPQEVQGHQQWDTAHVPSQGQLGTACKPSRLGDFILLPWLGRSTDLTSGHALGQLSYWETSFHCSAPTSPCSTLALLCLSTLLVLQECSGNHPGQVSLVGVLGQMAFYFLLPLRFNLVKTDKNVPNLSPRRKMLENMSLKGETSPNFSLS